MKNCFGYLLILPRIIIILICFLSSAWIPSKHQREQKIHKQLNDIGLINQSESLHISVRPYFVFFLVCHTHSLTQNKNMSWYSLMFNCWPIDDTVNITREWEPNCLIRVIKCLNFRKLMCFDVDSIRPVTIWGTHFILFISNRVFVWGTLIFIHVLICYL